MASYEVARRIALGLSEEAAADAFADDLWSVAPPPAGMAAQMSYQFFHAKIDTPPEIVAHKAALSLFDEYETDRAQAAGNLQALRALVQAGDAPGVRAFLQAQPPSEWLSLVFLDEDTLENGLLAGLENADEACRGAMREVVRAQLDLLKNYTELFTVILGRLGEK